MAVSWCWVTQKHPPKPLLSHNSTLTLPCRYLCCITPGSSLFSSLPKSSSRIQEPTTFSSFLFEHSFSFCFVGFKATESLQPRATDSSAKERQWGAQYWLGPNTKYNPLSPVGSVLHTLKTGDLAESLTACQSPQKKGSNWTGLQDEATQKPGAICPEQTSRGRYRLCVCMCLCVCWCGFACLCPAAALQIRRHHSLAGSSETPSWVISSSCAHLGWEKKPPWHNLGPLLCLVTAPNTLLPTNKQQCQHLRNRCPHRH